MSFEEIDPEVVADLRLRAATMRDTSRGSDPYDWKPPKLVGGQLLCRTCKIPVAVTEDTIERWWMFNGILRKRNEQPIAPDQIVFCDECVVEHKKHSADTRRREVDLLASMIRQLKETDDPQRERELIAQLRVQRHPDVDGLVAAIAARKATKRARSKAL